MAENSKIGWTDHTQNFWWGCTKVTTECTGPMRTVNWSQPRRWNRRAEQEGKRFRIFTCSMSDFFHPGADPWRGEAWGLIRACTDLDWLILTKRPELIADRLPSDWGKGYSNVWLGVTCGVQSSLPRVSLLKGIPATIRFVSAEPLLEPINFRPHLDGSIHWIITGCEQAGIGKRRAMDIAWVRDIDRQCRDAGIAHFFKQRYEGRQIVFDGLLDGDVRHAWPR